MQALVNLYCINYVLYKVTYSNETYHSEIYNNFKQIEVGDHRTLIRFFGAYEENIQTLDQEEQFELYHAYANALFDTKNYDMHIEAAERVVALSVLENIKFYEGMGPNFEFI